MGGGDAHGTWYNTRRETGGALWLVFRVPCNDTLVLWLDYGYSRASHYILRPGRRNTASVHCGRALKRVIIVVCMPHANKGWQ